MEAVVASIGLVFLVSFCISCTKLKSSFPFLGKEYSVYHQELTTSKYLKKGGLPAMTEATVCLRLNVEQCLSKKGKYFVSIATSGL